MDKLRVGIISSDPEFVDCFAQSCHRMHFISAVTLAETAGEELAAHAVVVTDSVQGLRHLPAGIVLAIAITTEDDVASDEGIAEPQAQELRVLRLPRGRGWADQAAVLAQETLLRMKAQNQVAEMEQRLEDGERHAALGRFIVEARHGIGNALLGVLGHSELLLLESKDALCGQAREKVETIRQMSLKMHETFHRFSSLDSELRRKSEQDSSVGGTSKAN